MSVATAESVEAAIEPLYELQTPDQVAQFLWERGARGARASGIKCPVARYLADAIGAPVHVGWPTDPVVAEVMWSADGQTCMCAANCDMPAGDLQRKPLPPVVLEFIHAFDHGEYPDLNTDG